MTKRGRKPTVRERVVEFVENNLPSTPGIAKFTLVDHMVELVEKCIDEYGITVCDQCQEIECDCDA